MYCTSQQFKHWYRHCMLSNNIKCLFTARCTLVQNAVLRSHVVCSSVCLSVTLVDCDHIGWNSPKIISHLVSLWCSLSADSNRMGLLQGEHPEIFARMGVGCGKKVILAYTKDLISLKRGKIGLRLLLRSNRKSYTHIRAFVWCQNQWPWMTLKGHYMHSVSKHVRLSELTVKIWIKIDLYCQRRRCSPMTLVSGNIIRFVPIFEGVHWRECVKRQWGNRKRGFSLELRKIDSNRFARANRMDIFRFGAVWLHNTQ